MFSSEILESRIRFICLANSRKKSGRCLAGKADLQGFYTQWIRPISGRESEELRAPEFLIHTGGEAQVLDLLEVKLLNHKPRLHQQENYLMDASVPLLKVGSVTTAEVRELVDSPLSLWGAGHSSKNGGNDFVPKEEIVNYSESLYLIDVRQLKLHISEEWSINWRRNQKVFRAEFRVGGSEYKLKITDPTFEAQFASKDVGTYIIEEALLTISLGEEFENKHWKLVAGVIPISFGERWISN